MRTSSRRRLDAAMLAGGGLVFGIAGAAGALVSNNERIAQMWVRADLVADGSADVTEVIDYEFGTLASDKHGILRIIPGVDPNAAITVSSDSAPDGLLVTTEPGGTQLRIGDATQTVTGRHRYTIDYPLPGVVRGSTLDWEAVGTEWDVPIEKAEIHLLAPYALNDVKCFVGSAGSDAGCDAQLVEPGHVMVEVSGLDANEGVSIEGTAGSTLDAAPTPPAAPPEPDDPGSGLLPPAAAAAAGALAMAGPATLMVRRAGRERVGVGGAADAAWATNEPVGERRVDQRELEQMATTEFAPPEGITPAQGGIVLREVVAPEHKVAWLIQEAISGSVDLVEENGQATRLVLTAQPATGAAPVDGTEALFLQQAFNGRNEVDLGAYDPAFGKAWTGLGGKLDGWRRNSGFWDESGEGRRGWVLALGIVGAVVGGLVAAAGGAAAGRWGPAYLAVGLVGGLIAGGGLAMALGSWELRVRTPAGTAAWLRVESFRRFLAGSEAYHAEEAAKRGVLREYTAWAVAVGEIDRWSRAVRSSSVIPADAGLSYAYMAPMLLMSTSATATAPSSSGSGGGGFGGGSVGGGAGGGGGGSW